MTSRQAPEIPLFPFEPGIPKLIHRICLSAAVPFLLEEPISRVGIINPDYQQTVYDDDFAADFLDRNYGRAFVKLFQAISRDYTAARADLFRYALMYKMGGVYLDLKSSITQPIRDVLDLTDSYILCQWDNGFNMPYEGWGLHQEVRHIPGGEFQQWHIIASRGHPFLRSVLQSVVYNLSRYRPWVHGTGQPGVLRTTGPLVYSRAIYPLMNAILVAYSATRGN